MCRLPRSQHAGSSSAHFEAARIALGSKAKRFIDYFDTCRHKRNVIDYDAAFVATDTEAEEILRAIDSEERIGATFLPRQITATRAFGMKSLEQLCGKSHIRLRRKTKSCSTVGF
jgi:hypothetical protein